MRRNEGERGQVVIMMLVAMSIFIFGAIGLAIDGANLYAQRQMAQAAADAAAQAAIMSIFDGTNANSLKKSTDFPTTAFDCTVGDETTPCVYAQLNGFTNIKSGSKCSDVSNTAPGDCVHIDFPDSSAVPGLVDLSTSDPVNLARATVSRGVETTLMRMLGPTATTVKAIGIAAILEKPVPTPILILHPTKAKALELDGTVGIAICGGPSRSVQVNSNSTTAYAYGKPASVDLHKAGPNGPADCTQEKMAGADFGTFGGPTTTVGSAVSSVNVGTDGSYRQPSSRIDDPYKKVLPPPPPLSNGTSTGLKPGFDAAAPTPHCPVGTKNPCILYTPGLYSNGINVTKEIAYFAPGIYYMGSGKGFVAGANAEMYMCPTIYCSTPDPTTKWLGQMLVYNSGGGLFDVGSNGNVDLVGSPRSSIYKGILLFEDRNAPPNNSEPGPTKPHNLGGGGCLSLTGTIYLTNTKTTMLADSSHYQEVRYHGNPCSNTYIRGDIVVDSLHIVGTSTLKMELNRDLILYIRQVALVK